MAGLMRRACATVTVAALALGACATGRPVPAREASPGEMQTLAQAVAPLLTELRYPMPSTPDGCRIGLVIVRSAAINASVGPGRRSPCAFFTLGVTEGALGRLSVDMLRAMLAHELAHVALGHLRARQERVTETPAVFRPLRRSFDREEEAEADRFAVALLRRIEPVAPGACVALVQVLVLLGDRPEGWLATHPSPERRAQAALGGCNAY